MLGEEVLVGRGTFYVKEKGEVPWTKRGAKRWGQNVGTAIGVDAFFLRGI